MASCSFRPEGKVALEQRQVEIEDEVTAIKLGEPNVEDILKADAVMDVDL